MDDHDPVGSSAVVATYANVYRHEVAELNFAFHIRRLLTALDCKFAFQRAAALSKLYRLIRDLPAPRQADPFAPLAREGSTGRGGSAPSLVAQVLKRTFDPTLRAEGGPSKARSLASAIEAEAESPAGSTSLHATASVGEMELALRVCQGVCILSPSQRALAGERDSRLLDVVGAALDSANGLWDEAAGTAAADEAGTRHRDVATPVASPPELGRQATAKFDDTSASKSPVRAASPATRASAGMHAATREMTYRVVLAALDAFEASAHFMPGTVVAAMKKHDTIRRIVSVIAESRHPTIVRQNAADVLGTLFVQSCNPTDWPDSALRAAFHNALRTHFKAVLDQRPDVRVTAAQLVERLGKLRDYRGIVAFKEVMGNSGGGLSGGDSAMSPSRRRGGAQQDDTSDPNARFAIPAREAETALLKLHEARKQRFDAFLDDLALPLKADANGDDDAAIGAASSRRQLQYDPAPKQGEPLPAR